MEIKVNTDKCTGCGGCVEVCPSRAISLMNGTVTVDGALCTQCEACIDACPTGAIAAMVDTSMVVQLPAVISNGAKTSPILTRPQPWLASALIFAGQTILPRLADALVLAVEHRLTQSTTKDVSPISPAPRGFAARGRGQRRRARRRGKRIGNRNYSYRR